MARLFVSRYLFGAAPKKRIFGPRNIFDKMKFRVNFGTVILFVVLALFSEIHSVGAHIKQHRVLRTNADNCSVPDHDESDFPKDVFTTEQRRSGALLLHITCGLYCFVVIAFVCNDYFLPAVDCICQDLNLSKDVAGATFMAFATSAPELFVNVVGTFLTESDLGVGTVVGSAVFNTLGVAACSGLAATTLIPLELWPLARDCSIYAFVVAVLTVILWDSRVEWYEALVLLFLYVVYCVVLLCQQRLHKAAKSVIGSNNSFHSQNSTVALHMDAEMSNGTYRPLHHHGEVIGWEKRPSAVKPDDVKSVELAKKRAKKKVEAAAAAKQKELESSEEEVPTSMCQPPDGGFMKKLWWFYSWPVAFLLHITIPDCRTRRALYPATFLMCVIWIGVTSYIVSWMMTIIGDTLGISDSVMGLTLVAMGGSMPEASTSIINAKRGIASMTISNALGGNTLDILLSLGLPWFIKTLLPSSASTGGAVVIQSKNLVYNNIAQLACVALLFVSAYVNRLRMDRRLGFVCLVLYLAFIVFIVCLEAGVFSGVKPIVVC